MQHITSSAERHIFTVSSLNAAVRRVLEAQWGAVWLLGEISNFSAPSSGHWYFTLKDPQAQVRCAMFRGNNARVAMRVGNGLQVLVRGRLSLYEPRGDYQLIVDKIEPAGEGLLQQEFAALKEKLQHEGLFAAERKRPLPQPIRRVGVITSATGAAIRDVLSVLARRDPQLQVIIYPTQVQGKQAAQQLRHTLALAIQRNEVDALLLTRGGGSLEDMWCFNDEQLARAIAASPLPVISAVGHEIDFCISDFVADVRAPTPSAAAELISQDKSELVRALQQLQQRIQRSFMQLQQQRSVSLQHLQQRLQPLSPRYRLDTNHQKLDDLQLRLQQATQRNQNLRTQAQQQLTQRLWRANPAVRITQQRQQLQQLRHRQHRAIVGLLNSSLARFSANQQALGLVSPLHTLQRGYTISFASDGSIIRHTQQVQVGDVLRTKLAEGELISAVTEIKKAQ